MNTIYVGTDLGGIYRLDPTLQENPHFFGSHRDAVRCIVIHDGKLYSGSDIVMVQDLDTRTYLQVFEIKSTMFDMVIIGNVLYAGAIDNKIHRVNIDNGQSLQPLSGHTGPVYALKVYQNKLYSGSSDNTIREWDPDTGKCLRTFITGDSVNDIDIDTDKLYAALGNGSTEAWDLSSGKHACSFEYSSSANTVIARDDKLCVGYNDGCIKIRDFKTRTCLNILEKGIAKRVTALALHNGSLYSGYDTGCIRLWNISTGECLQCQTVNGRDVETIVPRP